MWTSEDFDAEGRCHDVQIEALALTIWVGSAADLYRPRCPAPGTSPQRVQVLLASVICRAAWSWSVVGKFAMCTGACPGDWLRPGALPAAARWAKELEPKAKQRDQNNDFWRKPPPFNGVEGGLCVGPRLPLPNLSAG